jgi:aspartyl-tRNA(Asn)/glutamyl-tRNA(Gln) amidotransferase subunit C
MIERTFFSGKGHYAMALTKDEVQDVAMLARIALDAQQVESLQGELNSILEHIDRISSLDLEGVEPTTHSAAMVNVMREDEVRPGLDTAQALKNAPACQDGAFLIPRIAAPGGER